MWLAELLININSDAGIQDDRAGKKQWFRTVKTSFGKFYLYVPLKTRIFRGSLINQSYESRAVSYVFEIHGTKSGALHALNKLYLFWVANRSPGNKHYPLFYTYFM